MAKTFPLSNVPANCLLLSNIPAADNPENHSDLDYLEMEFKFNVKFAVELVLKKNDAWKYETRGNTYVREMEIRKQSEKYQKVCSERHGGCGFLNSNLFGWCRACGKNLLTMDALRNDNLRMQGSKLQSGHTTLISEERKRKLRYCADDQAKIQTIKRQNIIHGSSHMDSATLQVSETNDTNDINITPLSIVDLNPASHTNQQLIQEGFGALVGLNTHTGGAKTIALCADAGAYNVTKILQDKIDDFWIILGLGHVEMAVTRLSMRVMVAVLGNDHIYAHKFKKETNGPEYLKSCKSNKKSFQYTQLANTSLLVEFVKVYFLDRVGQEGTVIGTLEEIAIKCHLIFK